MTRSGAGKGILMDLNRYTERSRGFLQAAQTLASRKHHQRLTPEHLLKVLLDDEEGLARHLIRQAGGKPEAAVKAVDGALARTPTSGEAQEGQGCVRAGRARGGPDDQKRKTEK